MYLAWLGSYVSYVRAIVISAVFLIPTASHSTKLVIRGFEELISITNVIMEGEVVKVTSEYSKDKTIIYTFVQIAKVDVLKGRVDQNIVELRFVGGKTKDETIDVPSIPKFTVGERGIFFIRTYFDPTKTISMIEGFDQGKFVLKSNDRKEEIVQNAHGDAIVGYDELKDSLVVKHTFQKLNTPIPRDPKKDRLIDPSAEQKNKAELTKQNFTALIRKLIGKNNGYVPFKPYSNEEKLRGLDYKAAPPPTIKSKDEREKK